MKKSKLMFLPVTALCLFSAAGCTPDAAPVDEAPVIEGIEQIDCLEKQTVDLLDYVRAIDDADGDITASMKISVEGATVIGGVVGFDAPGNYPAHFSVTDSAGHTTEESLTVRVHARENYKTFSVDDFTAKFDGNQGAKGEMTGDGGRIVYRVEKFSVTDWANELSSIPFEVNNTAVSYVISFTAKATAPVVTTFAIPTHVGWDPTLTWQRFTVGTELKEYRFLIKSVPDSGPYYIVFQFGSESNAGLGETTIEIDSIALEVKSEYETFN